MRGTIVLNNTAGRSLRRAAADVHARDVLACMGGFAAGDRVYVTFRAVDGGQYAIAAAVACCGEAELRRMLGSAEDLVVLRKEDVRLLW